MSPRGVGKLGPSLPELVELWWKIPSSPEYVAAALQCAPNNCRDQHPTGSTEVAPGRVRSI